MKALKTSNLGYPRIGENREWKKVLEAFWEQKLTEEQFETEMKSIRLEHMKSQQKSGMDYIPVGNFTYYDHVLDTAVMFGLIPKRYAFSGETVPLHTYFSMARGNSDTPACEMTKWFNTNYHYIVPELEDDVTPHLTKNLPLIAYQEAKKELGFEGKPVIVGPFTLLKLSKGYSLERLADWIDRLLPLYAKVLSELEQEGVQWVQIDEPSLVTSITHDEMALVHHIYQTLTASAPKVNIMLQTYFDAVEHYTELVKLPVQGIGLDFVHGGQENLNSLKTHGFPKNKILGVGLIDGRGIWRSDLQAKQEWLQHLQQFVPLDRMWLQPSCSLLHVPVNLRKETALVPVLRNALAFTDEKLTELEALAHAISANADSRTQQIDESSAAVRDLQQSSYRKRNAVDQFGKNEQATQLSGRNMTFEERHTLQQEKWKLPLLPTTTIGSFPQTPEVRKARSLWRKGEWTKDHYDEFIEEHIRQWISIQEEIGLDVLVHGEFERTDMVEFFGEKLGGFAFSKNGWVQSYGSRCVKPPIIFGDVNFLEPMTVRETVYAQSLTKRPVKGMMTGPITILNWSFVRDDIARSEVAFQIALALQKEVEALESAGIEMIQIDEPALREGLPLKRKDWEHYLNWTVDAFRLTSCTVKPTTQIHTHMCYCEFQDIIDSIQRLDADVISIETSRSHGELIESFETETYNKGIGLGVYDIHSARIPTVQEMVQLIERAIAVLPYQLFWINPDCGLKTRGIPETKAALKKMVQAAEIVRNKIS